MFLLRRTLLSTTCLSAVMLTLAAGQAMANPQDGVVSSGSASITSNASTLTIHQSTHRAVIDWRSFDIGASETTQFIQPSSSSVTLNRVNSNSASMIDGRLIANGNIFIVNQNGVVFGNNAKVDVNGLVATTADIDNTNFMNGDFRFDRTSSNPNGTIVNNGEITAGEAGLVGLVAPNVINSGRITARLGRVQLSSGDRATIDLYGDGLIEVAADDATSTRLVQNTGRISAEGGTIAITAAAGAHMVNSLIRVSGELRAPAVGVRNGKIIIAAEGSNALKGNKASDKGKKTGTSTVITEDAYLDVSGRKIGESGGTIEITGDNVALLSGTVIDASGDTGLSDTTETGKISDIRIGSAGGDIRIGGDYLGLGITPTALNLYVDKDVLVLNDSLTSGDAGRTIFWSDDTTQFYGNVYARALGGLPVDPLTWHATLNPVITSNGQRRGSGGFVETSGHKHLDVGGYVDLTASDGDRGTYFLDPTDITIYGNVDPSFISTDTTINLASSLRLWLDASDTSKVNLTYNAMGTTATGTSGTNTITVSANTGLTIGARIRLGVAGAVTTASTVGADTYTISNISGTTITLSSNLTANYTTSNIFQGYVSQLNDKSGNSNNTSQVTTSLMPLWISNQLNGLGAMRFDGSDRLIAPNSSSLNITTNGLSYFGTANYTSNGMLINKENQYEVAIQSNQLQAAIETDAGGGWQWGGTSPVTPSTWKIVGFQHNNTQWQFYQEGNLTQSIAPAGAQTGNITTNSSVLTIGDRGNINQPYTGLISDSILYATALSNNSRNLVEQYQSAKWGLSLTPPGTGATEVAKATAADGYSVFTTRYLERLSQSANVFLQATNNINLDLKGDTLNFTTANRSLTLNAGNQITTASTGAITTNNSAISLTGTNGILFNNNFSLSSGTAATTLTTTNSAVTSTAVLTLGGDTTINTGNGNVALASINGDAPSARSLVVNAGTGTFTTTGTIGSTNKLNNLTVNAYDLVLGGNLSGSGLLTLKPTATSTEVRLNDNTVGGTFMLSSTELGYFVDGWAGIIIGNSASSGSMYIGATSWSDPITFLNNYRTQTNGNLTATDNASVTFNVGNSGWINTFGTITTAGQNVTVTGPGGMTGANHITTNGGSIIIGSSALISSAIAVSPTWSTSGGNITIAGSLTRNTSGISTAGKTFTLNAGTGNISLGGTVNGDYNLTATGTSITTAGAWGVTEALGDVTLTSTNGISLPIITTAAGKTVSVNVTGAGNAITTTGTIATGAAGNITLTADDLILGANLNGTGTLTLKPTSTNRNIRLNYGTGDFNLSTAEIGYLVDGWSGITIGRTDSIPSYTYIGNTMWSDPINFLGRTKSIFGTLTGTDNASFTFAGTGGIELNSGGLITTNNQNITFTTYVSQYVTDATINSNGGNITLSNFLQPTIANMGTVSFNSGGGNIGIQSINAGTVTSGSFVFNAGAGNITVGSIINTPANVTMSGATITAGSAWGGTTGLGNVTLTTTNSISLPAITTAAGKTVSVNVTGASNAITTTGTIATGALGNISLTADDLILGSNVSGTGILTLQPTNDARTVNVNNGTADGSNWNLSTAEIARLVDGWSGINVGRTSNSVVSYLGTSIWTDPIIFRSAVGRILSGLTGTGNASFTFTGASSWVDMYGDIITVGGIVDMSGINYIYMPNNGAITKTISTSGGNVALNILFLSNRNLTINAGTGSANFSNFINGSKDLTVSADSVVFSGTVNTSGNVSATASTITAGSAWGGTTPLGNTSLTSTNSLTLPSITASSIFARTTGASSDITIGAGKTLTASGTGNALTLASGRNFINSSGSATPLVTPSGRWLVYSANPALDTLGGMTSAFRRFSCSYSSPGACAFNATLGTTITMPGTGNGFAYSTTPSLTATPTALSALTYGDAIPSLTGYTYGLSGYLGSDSSADSITGSLNGATTYTQGSNIGTYNINYLSGSLASALGYNISTYANNASGISVGQRALTVTANNASRDYGDVNPGFTGTLLGVYSGDTITATRATPALQGSNIGTYSILNTLVDPGSRLSNYSITNTAGTLTIGQRALTVGLTGTVAKQYDGNNTATLGAGNYSLSNFYGTDGTTVTVATTLGTYDDKTATTGKIVNVSGLTLTGANSGNYSLSSTSLASTIGEVTQKALTLMGITATNRNYNGLMNVALAGAGSLSGLIGGDTVTTSGTGLGTMVDANVGNSKAVTVSGYTIGGMDFANYSFSQPTGITVNIGQASLVATANGQTITYGTNVPSGGVTYTGFVNSETSSVIDTLANLSSTNSGIVNAGTYTGNYTASGAVDNNYSFSYVAGDLIVNKALLTVTANNQSINYGAVAPSSSISYAGFVNGENSSVIDILPTLTSLSTGVVQAGRYSGNYTASGATDNNYGFSYINGNLDVLNVSLPSTVEYPSQYPIMISTQVGGNTGGQAVIYRIGTDENDTGDNENDSPTLTEEEAQFSSFRTKPIIITISPELVRILSLTQEDL